MEEKTHPLKGRKQSAEHIAKRARKCEPGCTCAKHKQTEEHRQKNRSGQLGRKMSPESLAKRSATRKARDKDPERRRRNSERRKKAWEEGKYENRRPATRRRVSNHEYKLAPYLEALGYRHNYDGYTFIGRSVPDFVDIEGRRVFEYFGGFWHPDPAEEFTKIAYYASKGWRCTVLWEKDLFEWLREHEHLVTPEQHEEAWKAAHVNYGYRKPEVE